MPILSLSFFLILGTATRYCDEEGVWLEPDVLSCQSVEFNNILTNVSHFRESERASDIT